VRLVRQPIDQRLAQPRITEHFKLPLTSNGLFLSLPLRIRVTRCMASG
jgi:hypothetical protein